MNKALDAVYGDPCKTDVDDIDLDAMRGMIREGACDRCDPGTTGSVGLCEECSRSLEARVVARMEASERRQRIEAMVRALVSGDAKMACTSPAYVVKHAEALLAEIDRRCGEEKG